MKLLVLIKFYDGLKILCATWYSTAITAVRAAPLGSAAITAVRAAPLGSTAITAVRAAALGSAAITAALGIIIIIKKGW